MPKLIKGSDEAKQSMKKARESRLNKMKSQVESGGGVDPSIEKMDPAILMPLQKVLKGSNEAKEKMRQLRNARKANKDINGGNIYGNIAGAATMLLGPEAALISPLVKLGVDELTTKRKRKVKKGDGIIQDIEKVGKQIANNKTVKSVAKVGIPIVESIAKDALKKKIKEFTGLGMMTPEEKEGHVIHGKLFMEHSHLKDGIPMPKYSTQRIHNGGSFRAPDEKFKNGGSFKSFNDNN